MNIEELTKSIDELRAAKEQLEYQLHTCIQKLVSEFENAVGITPDSISISLVDVTAIGDRCRKYKVGKVRTTLSVFQDWFHR